MDISFILRARQLIFLFLFCALNIVIFLAAESKTIDGVIYHATYHNAADGHRYWGTAINLIEKQQFSIPKYLYASNNYSYDPPLARAGPLPSIIFAIPMKLAGFKHAPALIVSIQCSLLFLMGFFVRTIGQPLGANKDLLQGLMIFNPNMIGLAHHGQSDLIFSFLVSLVLLFSTKILSTFTSLKSSHFVAVGIFSGLMVLSRPYGYFYTTLLPLILLGILLLSSDGRKLNIKSLFFSIILVATISQCLLIPWQIRNYTIFGNFSITQQEKSIMLATQHDLLLTYNNVINKGKHKELAIAKVKQALQRDKNCSTALGSGSLSNDLANGKCELLASIGYLHAIFSESPLYISRAFLTGWSGLFFSGGAGRLQNYLGLNATNPFFMFANNNFLWVQSLFSFISESKTEPWLYYFLFFICAAFSITIRLAGFVGLFVLLRKKNNAPLLVFHLLTLIIFTGFCLFYSLSRYRAPLEPTLMLLGAIGISTFLGAIRNRKYPDERNC